MASHYYPWRHGTVLYEKRGMGDPLVLVHGIYPGASHEEFHRNISELGRHFTVYAVDLLGFGDSDMPRMTYTVQVYQNLLRDFIVEEIGEAAHLMASGLGCGPAVSLAVYNDPLVRKMVLIDPSAGPSTPSDQPPSIAAKVQQFLLGTLSMGIGLYETLSSEFELKRFLVARYANPRNVTAEHVAMLHERAMRHHAMHGVISQITGHLSGDVRRWLRHVRRDVLVILGQNLTPPPTADFIPPDAPWSRGKHVEIIPLAAHWPHDEQSATVNRMVTAFLNADT